ncbi:hypothetical protein [Streptomyces sp. NRRL WC-3742]|nr:hypothetical protein [Streptomyces sp. NRRL WC-3742]
MQSAVVNLNILGRQGWEAVGFSSASSTARAGSETFNRDLLLKRPLQ